MRKHTEGPWKVSGNTELCITDVYDFSRFIGSASIMGSNNNFKESYEEAKANARLMSAAPDLLDALESCVSYGSMTGDEWVIEKARAAIAKAKGGL
jgi:hypothetical protein